MARVLFTRYIPYLSVGGIAAYGVKRLTSDTYKVNTVHASDTAQNVEGNNVQNDRSQKVKPPSQKDMKLLNVQVFFRHGARTPLRHIPIPEVVYDEKFTVGVLSYTNIPIRICDLLGNGKRPWSKLDERYKLTQFKGGVYAGQLTLLGKDQMLLLGRRLRKRYIEQQALVGKGFSQDNIYIQSTNIKRTIQSAQCVIAGMFDYESFKNTEPVVINVLAFPDEYLYPNVRHCKTLSHLTKKATVNLRRNAEYMAVHNRLQDRIGDRQAKLELIHWRDHIVARQFHGLPVPDWLKAEKPDIEKAAVMAFKEYICGGEQHRLMALFLGVGQIYSMVTDNMKAIADGSSVCKPLHLYSCHDSTLFPMLDALGGDVTQWPPYSADLAFELYTDKDDQKWVKVVYCGEDLVLNGYSQALLPLADFQEIIKPYSITKEEFSCRCDDVEEAKQHAEFWAAALREQEEEESSGEDENLAPPMMD